MDAQQIGFLFPGQGAQVPGMGRSLYAAYGVARELFERAADVLGYDLAAVCFDGPAEKLNETQYSQPALFVTSMAAIAAMREVHPEWIERGVAAAGLSLGEYTAVCFAGGLDFDSALRLVQLRGLAMQRAADQTRGGMASVLGLELDQAEQLCREVRREGEVLQPANLLCPGNIAISGHLSAIARVEEAALRMGAMKVVPLAVAGAFHTSLMQSAVGELEAGLARCQMSDTRLPVYSNVDAQPHQHAGLVRELLTQQVVSPVRWEASLRQMIADGIDGFLEVGTGRVLRGTLKRIDRKIAADGFGDE